MGACVCVQESMFTFTFRNLFYLALLSCAIFLFQIFADVVNIRERGIIHGIEGV